MKAFRNIPLAFVASLFLFSATLAEASPVEWTVASGGNGHFYELVTTPTLYVDAVTTAAGMGGYLATVTSAAENAFLAGLLTTGFPAWLGGFQNPANPGYVEPAGGWEWSTGEPFVYTNWAGGEPGDTFTGTPDLGGNEDHLGMNGAPAILGTWFDINGSPGYGALIDYFVEYDSAPPAPEFSGVFSSIPNFGWIVSLAGGLLGLAVIRRRP